MDGTGAVRLRRYQPGDAQPLVDAAIESTAQVFPWMPWCHPGFSLEQSSAWIDYCTAAWEQQSEHNFVIADDRDRLLGGCGLNQIKREHRVANLGYWVRTSATGKGIATRAVRELVAFAFGETDLVRLEVVVAVGNHASCRVAEKVGGLREGIAHDRLYMHGRSHDAIVYAVLRSRIAPPAVA